MNSAEIQRQIDSVKAQLVQTNRDLDGALNDPQRFVNLETKRQASETHLARLDSALADAQTREAAAQEEVDKKAAENVLEESRAGVDRVNQEIKEKVADAARQLENTFNEIEPLRAQLAEYSDRYNAAYPIAHGSPVRFGEGLTGSFWQINPAVGEDFADPPAAYVHASLALTVLLHDLQGGPTPIRDLILTLQTAWLPSQYVAPPTPEPVAPLIEDEFDPDDYPAFIARTHRHL